MSDWEPVGPGTPVGPWLETRREGESGTNFSFCRIMCLGDEPEWIDREGYSTLVNPGSFAPPTHWRWPKELPGEPVREIAVARRICRGREHPFCKETCPVQCSATADDLDHNGCLRDARSALASRASLSVTGG